MHRASVDTKSDQDGVRELDDGAESSDDRWDRLQPTSEAAEGGRMGGGGSGMAVDMKKTRRDNRRSCLDRRPESPVPPSAVLHYSFVHLHLPLSRLKWRPPTADTVQWWTGKHGFLQIAGALQKCSSRASRPASAQIFEVACPSASNGTLPGSALLHDALRGRGNS
ncbi:hypothetical protein K466DRAFT_570672, partial [Polyporus arcularius HHB13444]